MNLGELIVGSTHREAEQTLEFVGGQLAVRLNVLEQGLPVFGPQPGLEQPPFDRANEGFG